MSNRWHNYRPKTLVEHCETLVAKDIILASIDPLRITQAQRGGHITITPFNGSGSNAKIRFETYKLASGTILWFFRCPGIDEPCDCRVLKLYRPLGGTQFACRKCHALVYSSSRKSRKFRSWVTIESILKYADAHGDASEDGYK